MLALKGKTENYKVYSWQVRVAFLVLSRQVIFFWIGLRTKNFMENRIVACLFLSLIEHFKTPNPFKMLSLQFSQVMEDREDLGSVSLRSWFYIFFCPLCCKATEEQSHRVCFVLQGCNIAGCTWSIYMLLSPLLSTH